MRSTKKAIAKSLGEMRTIYGLKHNIEAMQYAAKIRDSFQRHIDRRYKNVMVQFSCYMDNGWCLLLTYTTQSGMTRQKGWILTPEQYADGRLHFVQDTISKLDGLIPA